MMMQSKKRQDREDPAHEGTEDQGHQAEHDDRGRDDALDLALNRKLVRHLADDHGGRHADRKLGVLFVVFLDLLNHPVLHIGCFRIRRETAIQPML